jgi:transposase
MAPETLDSLDAESLKPLLHQLLARIDDLLAENKKLLARVAELEAKLGQPPKTPDNSSLPPSRGQKANAEPPPAGKSPRKGHPAWRARSPRAPTRRAASTPSAARAVPCSARPGRSWRKSTITSTSRRSGRSRPASSCSAPPAPVARHG